MDNNDFYDAQPHSQPTESGRVWKSLDRVDFIFIGFDLFLIILIFFFREWIFRYLAGIIYRLAPGIMLIFLIVLGIIISWMKNRKNEDRAYERRKDY